MHSYPVTQLPHPPERDTIRNVNPLRQTQPRRREPDRPSIISTPGSTDFFAICPMDLGAESFTRISGSASVPSRGRPRFGIAREEGVRRARGGGGDDCVPTNLQRGSPSSSQDGEKDGVTDSGSQVPEATQDFSGVPDIDNIDSHRESAHLNRNTLQIRGLKSTISVTLLVVLVDAFHSFLPSVGCATLREPGSVKLYMLEISMVIDMLIFSIVYMSFPI
ncbi:hypothetical protein VPH35_029194 [Triticum aestivum]|uniref:uncharacterized protein n=1 Tax=Triticum aestivum TaxID=4565 RepID=UPI000842D51F|nr:uncharacterized protein LOC123041331 [Triticum aestivum]